jgi:hypothetical protein
VAGNPTIKVAITADTRDLTQGLEKSQSKLSSFGKAVGKMAVAAGVVAAAGVAKLGAVSVQAASDAQQSIGATETVFGKFAGKVVKHSEAAAESVGLSANAYRQNANVLGSLLGNQGVAQDKLAGKTRKLIGTAADLSATFGGTTSEAVEALASAFKGEFDPLEKYGVSIKQSTINTEAYRVAGVKTKADFDKLSASQQAHAKQLATTNLLMKQSHKTMGAFGSESETFAHQQQVLGAQWENLKVKIGNVLLPVLTQLLKKFNEDLMPVLDRLADQYLPKVKAAFGDLFEGDPKAKVAGIGDAFKDVDWGTISDTVGELGGTLKELGPALKEISVDQVNDGIKVFGEVVEFAADHVDLLRKALPFLVAGFVGLKGVQLLNQAVGKDSLIGMAAQLFTTRQLTKANRELAAAVREVNGASKTSGGVFDTAGGAAEKAKGKFSKFGAAARGAAGLAGIGLLTAGLSDSDEKTGTLMTTLGGAATGLAVGGPIGAAIGGFGGLLFSLGTKFEDTGKKARESYAKMAAVDSVKVAEASMKDLKGTLDSVTGAYTENTRAAVYNELQKGGQIATAAKYGISAREVVNAALGQGGAFKKVAPILKDYDSKIAAITQAQKDYITEKDKSGRLIHLDADGQLTKSAQKHVNALEKQKLALKNQKAELETLPGVLSKAAAETRAATAATRDYSGKLKGLPKKLQTQIEAKGVTPTIKSVARLANRYKLSPKQIKTLIKATGVKATVKDVKRVQKNLKDTGNTKPDLGPYRRGLRAGLRDAKVLAYTGGHGVGSSLKQGTEDGVGGIAGMLSTAVTTAVNAAIIAGRQAADAHSPSKRMLALGKDMGAGLVIGLDSMQRSAAMAGASQVDAVAAGMQKSAASTAVTLSTQPQWFPPPAAAGAAAGTAGGTAGTAPEARQLAPRQTPVQVLLDGHVIADRLDLRRSLAASESVRRTA